MTDTPEAVRLPEPFGYLCDWGNDAYGLPRQIVYYGEPGSATEDDWNEYPKVHNNTPIYTAEQVAALLRRIPELEAERDQLRAELEKARVPEGWSIKKLDLEDAVVINGPSGGCVAVKDASIARVIPESILYELACVMLTSSPTPPHADQKGQ